MEVSIQTDKPKISEKRLEALRKGREEHHRRAREYKLMMAEKEKEKTEPVEVIPLTAELSRSEIRSAKPEKQISFLY
jgi:hypothetical protein